MISNDVKFCDRCGNECTCWTMSMFNTQLICMQCKEKEKKDPKYKEAVEAEREAVVSVNYNFKGIGL